jgi:hypothetical protein
MKYETVKEYSAEKFRRITGVKRETFAKMIEILQTAHAEKHKRRGRNPKMRMEDRLLAALEYWREYRTYAHIGASFGLDESNMQRSIKWIEDVLIKDGTFALPGKKALLQSDTEIDTALIDATESPIERPKKDSGETIPAKRSGTR